MRGSFVLMCPVTNGINTWTINEDLLYVDMLVNGSGPGGAYSGSVSTVGRGRWGLDSTSRLSVLPAEAVQGSVTGAYTPESVLLSRTVLTPGRHWPQFTGPNDNFTATATGVPLVDGLRQRRLVWIKTTGRR